MPKIQIGVSDPATFFNLDNLDRVRGNYQVVYNDVQVDASGVPVVSLLRVGLQEKFTGDNLQLPVLISDWTDTSDVAYSLLSDLLTDMASFGVFTNL